MARPLRIEFPGALYHVTSRGNAREPIFLDDGDRQAFLVRLGEVVDRHRWRCFSYCIMTNQPPSVWRRPPSWLVIEGLLARFGSRSRYLQFVGEGVGAPSPWSSLRGGLLGSDAFVERLAGRLERRAVEGEFPRRERLVHRETLAAAFPPPVLADRTRRDERIRELAASSRFTAAEIGRHLGLHYSTISRIAARPATAAAAAEPSIQDSRSDPLGA